MTERGRVATNVLEAPQPESGSPSAPRAARRLNWATSIPFLALQAVPLLAIFTGVSRTALILLACTYFGRMFFITAGYHRYFSHRSYRLGRVAQSVFAFGGLTCAQKGPLWWAAGVTRPTTPAAIRC